MNVVTNIDATTIMVASTYMADTTVIAATSIMAAITIMAAVAHADGFNYTDTVFTGEGTVEFDFKGTLGMQSVLLQVTSQDVPEHYWACKTYGHCICNRPISDSVVYGHIISDHHIVFQPGCFGKEICIC